MLRYFYVPPFDLDFNMNSTVCAGQSFEFQCIAEPTNYGINLTLYRLDPLLTLDNLESVNALGAGIDFRNTKTKLLQVWFSMIAVPQGLAFSILMK